jgi:hypothetical protein
MQSTEKEKRMIMCCREKPRVLAPSSLVFHPSSPEAEFLDVIGQKSSEFYSLLFTVTSTENSQDYIYPLPRNLSEL